MSPEECRKVVKVRGGKSSSSKDAPSVERKHTALSSPVLAPTQGAVKLFTSIRRLWNAVIPIVQSKPASTLALPDKPSSSDMTSEPKPEEEKTKLTRSSRTLTNLKSRKKDSRLRPSVTFESLPSGRRKSSQSSPHSQVLSKNQSLPLTSPSRGFGVDNSGIQSNSSSTTRQFRREPTTARHSDTTSPDDAPTFDSSPHSPTFQGVGQNSLAPIPTNDAQKVRGGHYVQNETILRGNSAQTRGPDSQIRSDGLLRNQVENSRRLTRRQAYKDHQTRALGDTGAPSSFDPNTSRTYQNLTTRYSFGFRRRESKDTESNSSSVEIDNDTLTKPLKTRKPTVREIIAEGKAAERVAKEKVQSRKLNAVRAGNSTKDESLRNQKGTYLNHLDTAKDQKERVKTKIRTLSEFQQRLASNHENSGSSRTQASATERTKDTAAETNKKWRDILRLGQARQKDRMVEQVANDSQKKSVGQRREGRQFQPLAANSQHAANKGVVGVADTQNYPHHGRRLSDAFEEEIREGDLSPVVRPSNGDSDLQDVWNIRLASNTRRMVESGSRSVLSAPPSPGGGGEMILSRVGSPNSGIARAGYSDAAGHASSPVCTTCLYKALAQVPAQHGQEGQGGSLGSPVTICGHGDVPQDEKFKRNTGHEMTRDEKLDRLYSLIAELREHDRRCGIEEQGTVPNLGIRSTSKPNLTDM